MNFERGEKPKPCPYWKKFIYYDNHFLALCGVETPGEQIRKDIEGERSEVCPRFGFSGQRLAYARPVILEVCIIGQYLYSTSYPGVETNLSGLAGIKELEQVWLQEEENFIQRHSQPQ